MGARPDISIVTPTRNRVALLRKTMDSVAAQTHANWEHLIIDDGSEDSTAEEVANRAKTDPRFRYLARSGEVTGANVSRNIGIREARGDLVILLDSDDLIRPDCLSQRVAVMARNQDLDFAVFQGSVFDKSPGDLGRLFNDKTSGDDLYRFLAHDTVWQTTGPVWRSAFLRKLGGFDEELISLQDLELHVRALAAGARYLRFPQIDHDIRWEEDSQRTSVKHFNDPDYAGRVDGSRRKMNRVVSDAGLMTWSRSRALAGLAFTSAEVLMRLGLPGKAKSVWQTGCREQRAPWTVMVTGLAMLLAGRMGAGALVNKWKGWARLRQEPGLWRMDNR
jgi:hypothetical protein